MNSANDVLKRVLDILSGELTTTAIDTWFDDTTAVAFKDSRLVICCPSAFKREVIEAKFLTHLKNALTELFAGEVDLLILGEDEVAPFLGQGVRTCKAAPAEERESLTFDRFIVGSNNKFAHATARAVAEKPAVTYNPLFIYGNSGLGKTHLLYAIRHAIKEQFGEMNIVYVKGDGFTNELIHAIQSGKNEEFRMKYRSADVLLVDDIQFIRGKDQTQEEFFHTFNALYESGCQIVLTSDRPPKEIDRLEDRLKSRFEWGITADVGPPDYETRIAIIQSKALELGVTLPADVADYIAENITANIRQLEGAVKKLSAYQELLDANVDRDFANKAIQDILKSEFLPTPELIIQETARYFTLSTEDIRGRSRIRDTATARQVSMYLIRKLTDLSLADIGKEYQGKSGGGMDHTSVLNSIRKIEQEVKNNPAFRDTVQDIQTNITDTSGQS
ncbi:MAG: chromosomal replication initiator protein DnaA [Oscillospiraceae bacterium]|nr:chromosomal replication initiator protein DnaA [Oscillospiraceae bacterium]